MTKILLVTSNHHKLEEWRGVVPKTIQLDTVDVDIPEIQSDDPQEIVVDKAKHAYAEVGQPVVVEDVSAHLEKLGGLPGPFVKFFNKRMGNDALYLLAGEDGAPAMVSCSIAYYDGENLVTVRGDIPGKVVAPRGDSAFGFDAVFQPDGFDKTFAEMGQAEKNLISHRKKAIELLVKELSA